MTNEEQQRLKIYENALSEVLSQITKKRSELAELAKKEISALDARIPELKAQEEELKKRVYDLGLLLDDRLQKYSQSKESYKKEFEAIKEVFIKSIDEQQRVINKNSKINDSLYESLKKKESDLAERERILSERSHVLELSINKHNSNVNSFNSEMAGRAEDCSSKEKRLLSDIKRLDEESARISEEKQKLSLERVVLVNKINEAKAVIERINEANEMFERAKALSEETSKKIKYVRDADIKNRADAIEISRRLQKCKEMELVLAEKEKNINIIMGKI